MSDLKKLQFKTKLPMPAALSFIKSDDPICRGTIEIKANTANIYHDRETGQKITVPFWGYALEGQEATYPGPTIEVNSHQRVEIDWLNAIGLNDDGTDQELRQPVVAIDVEYCEADDEVIPQNVLGVPDNYTKTMGACGKAYVTPHQHGGKTAPKYDGGPLDMLAVGQSHIHRYENNQRAAMLWYHDHAMHTTRLNAFAGLAALYVVRDDEEASLNLPTGDYEIPLVIQDRNLTEPEKIDDLISGKCDTAEVQLLHKVESGDGPLEFFGPLNLVNGALWPVKEVEGTCYRVRILNGANSRSYRLLFAEKKTTGKGKLKYVPCSGIKVRQIGTDGGLIPSQSGKLVKVPPKGLTLSPAERADLLIDFSAVTGKKIYVINTAGSPFAGISADLADAIPDNPAQDENRNPYPEVMCFDVKAECSAKANNIDFDDLAQRMASLDTYNKEVPCISNVKKTRTIAVVEKDTPNGAVLVLWELMPVNDIQSTNPILKTNRSVIIDGECFYAVAERYHDPVSIIIPKDSTERWRFVNLTADTHPMHIHLVQYLPISRRKICSINNQIIDHEQDDKGDTILDITAQSISNHKPIFLSIEAMSDENDLFMGLDENEKGLKDTVRMNPGEMVEVIAKFDEHCGRYVYHCHLLEHEDHDMMRQFIVTRSDLSEMDREDSMDDDKCKMGHMFPISVGVDM